MLTALVALGLTCGTERWDVKTLADRGAARVDVSHPKESSVAALTKMSAPAWSDSAPRAESEEGTYTMTAYLIGYKLEADEDVHIVIADDPLAKSGTMIAEIPASDCVQGSKAEKAIDSARQAFRRMFQNTPPRARYRRLRQPQKVTVTGVPFFDKLHGQTGVAPNGIELHPVLAIGKAR